MAEIASAFVTIAPSMRGFGTRLQAGASTEIDSAGRSLGTGFGKVFALAAAGIIAGAVGSFFKDAIGQASDAQQSLGATETVFGKFADTVVKTSDQAAQRFGLSANTYRESANLIGSLFKNQGVATDQLAGKTEQMIGIGSDLAATFGGTTTEAVETLGAAFKGEYDSIERYGISLKESTVTALLAKRGQDGLTGSAAALAKQQAVTDLIMRQSKDSIGAFGRESNTLAGQQQRLSASFDNLKAKIGTAFLPVLTQAVNYLNATVLPAIAGLGPVVAQVGAFFQSLGSQVGGSGFGAALTSVAESVRANFIPVIQTMAQTFVTVILPAFLQFANYLRGQIAPVLTQIGSIIAGQVVPILARLAQFVYGTLYPAMVAMTVAVAQRLRPAFEAFVGVVRGQILPAVQNLLAKFQQYQPTIQKVIVVVVLIIGKLAEFAATILGKVLPPVIKFAGFMLGNFINAISGGIQIIAALVQGIIKIAGAIGDAIAAVGRFLTAVKEKFNAALDVVRAIPGQIKGALGDLGNLLYGAGQELLSGLISGISSKIGDIKSKMSEVASAVKGFLPGSPVKTGPLRSWNRGNGVSGAGFRLMGGLARGIKDGAPAVAREAGGAAEKVSSAFREKLEALRDKVSGVVDNLRSEFKSLRDSIASTFAGDLFSVQAIEPTNSDLFKLPDNFAELSAATQAKYLEVQKQINDRAGTSGATAAQSFISNLMGTKAELSKLRAAFKKLVSFGLSPAFLGRLFESGNGGLILDLAAGGRAQAKQAQSLFGDVNSLSKQLGTAVAKNDPSYSELVKQTNRLERIEQQLKNLPKGIGREINGAAARGKRGGNQ